MKDKLMLSGRSNRLVKPLAFALMGFGALLTAQSATAGEFGVQVLDESGAPVMGASVCVGLPGNYKQFGAMFTDEEGRAIVEVPNVPIVVTVSKTRFSGIRMSEPARRFNLIKQVTLPEGVPGPRCRAGSTLASESSIVIEKVDVLEGARATSLRPVVSGQPSQYRVSRTPDVTNSQWQSFETDIALSEGLSGEQEVYLQMRRFEGSSKSWIEARSVIVTVNLPVYQ